MPRKTFIIIGSVIITIVIILGAIFFYLSSTGTTPGGVLGQIRKLSPFGGGDTLTTVRNLLTGKGGESGTSATSTLVSTDTPEEKLLFKLSDERVSGLAFTEALVPITIEVTKRILIDDPRVAAGTRAPKISVLATTTESSFATSSRVRYVEQGSGNIYEYNIASSTNKKITNTTIPRTAEAYFLDKGNSVILRYPDSQNLAIETYLAKIPTSSVTDSLSGVFLPNNIQSISVSPSGNEFVYLAKTANGSIANIYNIRNNTERRVFSSGFSEWLPAWVGADIFMTTKASYIFSGVVYKKSTVSDLFTRVTGDRFGLTSLPSPNGSLLLVGEGVRLSVLTVSTGQTVPVSDFFGLPEKCVWKDNERAICFGQRQPAAGSFPDDWYKGLFSFDDTVWIVDARYNEVYELASPRALSEDDSLFDGQSLSISPDKSYISFINKRTGLGYVLKLYPSVLQEESPENIPL